MIPLLTVAPSELKIEIKELVQKGRLLNAKLFVSNINEPFASKTSPEFVINSAAVFQMRVVTAEVRRGNFNLTFNNLLFVRFTKQRLDDDLNYMMLFNSVELNVTKTFTSDDGTWHLIHENDKRFFMFDVSVAIHLMGVNSFAVLHEDTELTDFEMRGEDGSVRMHRAVLAAASPVLRRMLSGAWREAAEGHVDVAGTSRATLEHLKNYIYLNTLPQTGLEQLLLLSCYYMMPELEQRCVEMLVRNLDSMNACNLIEFAAKNSMKRLLLAVLERVQSGAISVTEMRNFLGDIDEWEGMSRKIRTD